MSDSTIRVPDPSTEQQFAEGLGELLRSAHDNGVSVQTGWAYRHDGDGYPDWDVQITRVKKRHAASDDGHAASDDGYAASDDGHAASDDE